MALNALEPDRPEDQGDRWITSPFGLLMSITLALVPCLVWYTVLTAETPPRPLQYLVAGCVTGLSLFGLWMSATIKIRPAVRNAPLALEPSFWRPVGSAGFAGVFAFFAHSTAGLATRVDWFVPLTLLFALATGAWAAVDAARFVRGHSSFRLKSGDWWWLGLLVFEWLDTMTFHTQAGHRAELTLFIMAPIVLIGLTMWIGRRVIGRRVR